MKYTVNLMNAANDELVQEIFSDTLDQSLEEMIQYYRGFVISNLNLEDGGLYYLKMEVEDVSGNESKYEYIGAYSPDEESAELFAGGYRSKTHGMYVDFGRGLHPADNTVTATVPTEYKLAQNFPNPFNPTTTIKYSLPKDGLAQLKVYDIAGKEVMTLVNEVKVAGNYEVRFNGANLSSGIYFYRIIAGDFVQTKRMVLVK